MKLITYNTEDGLVSFETIQMGYSIMGRQCHEISLNQTDLEKLLEMHEGQLREYLAEMYRRFVPRRA